MYYVAHGSIPRQRHTQHRAPDGTLYAEELFGVEGFTGRSSLLYHLIPPTRTHKIEPVRDLRLEAADELARREGREHGIEIGRAARTLGPASAARSQPRLVAEQ